MADSDHLSMVVFGLLTIDALWTAYLEFRNIQAMEASLTPPPILDIGEEEFNQIATTIEQESSQKLIATISRFWIECLQFHSNYYSFVWQLSGKYCSSMTARAMWFAALDQTITVLLLAVSKRPHSPSALSMTLSIFLVAPTFALYTLLRIKIFEMLGATGMFLVLNITGLAIGVLACVVKAEVESELEYTELVEDDLGTAVKALAVKVGYPQKRIFILETLDSPNASYQNIIFSKWITIHRSLTFILNVPEVVAVVAHELGHWKYCHHFYRYLTLLVVEVTLYFLYTRSYGNPRLLRVFSLSDAHPVLGELLALQFIGLPVMKTLIGGAHLLNSHHEMVADDYACQIWDPKNVLDSELKIYWFLRTKHYHYESFYSRWYTGYPSLVQRVSRLESHFNSN